MICIITIVVGIFFISSAFTGVESVYLGGMPIGVVQSCNGVVIAEYIDVHTDAGKFSPAKKSGLLKGDVIKSIDNTEVFSSQDVAKLIGAKNVSIAVERGGNIYNYSVSPAYDVEYRAYKLGISVKNEISGIGTMTFVTQTKRFAGVGHKIYDKNISTEGAFPSGKLFSCNIVGVEKSTLSKMGELKGNFNRQRDLVGKVEKNTVFGLYGKIDTDFVGLTLMPIAKKDEIVVGEALIYTTINGDMPSAYSIEIIKLENQSSPTEKSMILRVTDPALIDMTGGIVPGMSGSPIVQNGKLIGAVTHVFTSDPLYGYGLYIDWMINN